LDQNETVLIKTSTAEVFSVFIEKAAEKSKFKIEDSSRAYVLSILEKYIFAEALFTENEAQEMIAEAYLKALQEEKSILRQRKLIYLGESLLFKSGFFAESFKRKIVGLSYYINMGGAAYKNLFESSGNPVHRDLSNRFSGYVDLMSEVSNQMNFTGDEDLVVLFDRYLELGSDSAYSKLIELGVTPADTKKKVGQ
jgi:hypothetical protein